MSTGNVTNNSYYLAGRTLLKTFVSTVLGQLIIFGTGILDLTSSDWKAVAAAGLAAVILTGYNALNPSYPDYGVHKLEEKNDEEEI